MSMVNTTTTNADTTSYSLANNWLDYVPSTTTTIAGTYVSNWPWLCYTYSYVPKIKLKLSEIERLREAARKDSDLKAVLNKFTQHIEVEIDF